MRAGRRISRGIGASSDHAQAKSIRHVTVGQYFSRLLRGLSWKYNIATGAQSRPKRFSGNFLEPVEVWHSRSRAFISLLLANPVLEPLYPVCRTKLIRGKQKECWAARRRLNTVRLCAKLLTSLAALRRSTNHQTRAKPNYHLIRRISPCIPHVPILYVSSHLGVVT